MVLCQANNEYCRLFHVLDGPAARVAVVGNGPLTAGQRAEIAGHDTIIRFNELNNRYCSDMI